MKKDRKTDRRET